MSKLRNRFRKERKDKEKVTKLTKFWSKYKSVKAAGEKGELRLYGDITKASVEQVANYLDKADGEAVSIRINSPGGDYNAGIAIANRIMEYEGEVTTINDGLAASSAAIVFLAGDERVMYSNATFMIHAVWAVAIGDSKELAAMAKRLEKATNEMVKHFAEIVDLDEEGIRALMDEEEFLNSEECATIGVCTEVRRASKNKAQNEVDDDDDDEKNEVDDDDDDEKNEVDDDEVTNSIDIRVRQAQREIEALENKTILERLKKGGIISYG